MKDPSVRIDVATHEMLKGLADDLGATVGEAVALAVRCLRQEQIGRDLANPLTTDETEWLHCDLG